MKKLFCGLFLATVSLVFSFDKISNKLMCFIEEEFRKTGKGSIDVLIVDMYIGDQFTRDGWDILYQNNGCFSSFPVNPNPADNKFADILFCNTLTDKPHYSSFFKYNKDVRKYNFNLGKFDSQITDKRFIDVWRDDLYDNYPVIISCEEFISLVSKVKVKNNKESVELMHPDGRVINFKKALLAYMQKHEDYSTVFAQFLGRFDRELDYESDEFKCKLVNEMLGKNRVIYSKDQVQLLKDTEILAIWFVSESTYTNKKYIECKKGFTPNFESEEKTKLVNNTVVGLGYNEKDNSYYNWKVNLGDDILVLFDYAENGADIEYSRLIFSNLNLVEAGLGVE